MTKEDGILIRDDTIEFVSPLNRYGTYEEYEMMKYVGELVRNQDAHQPLNMKDVTKIIEKAKKIGGLAK